MRHGFEITGCVIFVAELENVTQCDVGYVI
jgi:hypothetical protein